MTFQQFLLALRYRWRQAFAVWAVTLLVVGLLAIVLVPSRYRAAAEILIEEENLDAIAGVMLPGSNLASRITTEADVVRSQRVMLRALQALGAEHQKLLRERWQSQTGSLGDFNAWAVEDLQRTTEVRPTRDSRVLYVSHSGTDPRFAAAFVNALVKAYIETSVDLRVEPARQYNAFFDERAAQLRERLYEAQRKASDFQRRNGITTTDEKADVEDVRLADLSMQVSALQARAGEAQRRQSEAAASPDQMEEVLRDPMVASLSTALSIQQARQGELMERLGNRHPQVIESLAATAGLTERLANAKRRAAGGFEGGSKVLASQLAERSRALELQREKVLQRKAAREQAKLLQNEVDVAQRAFNGVVDRLNKTTLEKAAPQVSVSVLKVATIPSMAASASFAAKAAVGAVVALLLALVSIVIAEVRDRRLRSAQDVHALRQPVLAVLHQRKPRGAASSMRPLLVKPRPALTSE